MIHKTLLLIIASIIGIGVSFNHNAYPAAEAVNSDYQKGLTYYSEKKFLLAIGSFRKAVESGYQNPKLFFYLGNALTSNEDYDKAIEQYKVALELADTQKFQGIIEHNLAYTFYLKKEYKKSIDTFNKAYGMDSNLVQTYWFKGLSFYRLKDKDNTITEWENYVSITPTGPESDNIRKALEILKSTNFDINKDKLFASEESNTNTMQVNNLVINANNIKNGTNKAPDVKPLIDIEGVLSEIKPTDKGKVTDDSLEEIEK